MISDQLREALRKQRATTEAGYAIEFDHAVGKAIPGIVALERCRELLKSYRWTFDYPAQVQCCSACDQPNSRECLPGCEIAKALEAAHD